MYFFKQMKKVVQMRAPAMQVLSDKELALVGAGTDYPCCPSNSEICKLCPPPPPKAI